MIGLPHTDWAVDDAPPQSGRTALVTGATSGIGFETARALARRGAALVLPVRNAQRGEAVAERIRAAVPDAEIALYRLDLTSLASVAEAAAAIREAHPRLDLLINNAGVMWTPFELTVDGFELQLATNHLGPFALTGLLLDRLLSTPGSRVVTVSSLMHRIGARVNFDDLNFERDYKPDRAYGQAKLANLMFTFALQRRLAAAGARTIATAAHPGWARTGLGHTSRRLRLIVPLGQEPAIGALPTLRAAVDPAARGGAYYGPSRWFETRGVPAPARANARAREQDGQERLWEISEQLTGVTYDFTMSPAFSGHSKGETNGSQ
jgi:NAD(P)-dependent dehydrogenase (short-subunit alcohol dehydrogenase family)